MLALIFNFALLLGAHLTAVQIRLRIPWGNPLGTEYQGAPVEFALIILAASLISYGIGMLPLASKLRGRRVWLFGLSLLMTIGGVLILIPDVSQLQMIYFGVSAVTLGLIAIVYPDRLLRRSPQGTLWYNLSQLWKARALLQLWLGYNIQSRYSQTILGILWIILLPLATAGVLSIAFSQILQVQYDVPFVSFFLSGLVWYTLFNQGTLNSINALISRMGIMNQVPFPREVVVLLSLGETLVDLIFAFGVMVIINWVNGIVPNGQYIYLIPLLAILVCFTLGIMFFVSCLTVFVRDVPQLVSVVLQLLFYLTPLLYPVSQIPDRLRVLILINPLAGVIQGFREVILYARPPDIVTLYYPTAFALTLLYVGYIYFITNKDRVTDYA
ncbi:MAG: ABC transporter permease [Anaerolineae bacterium]|nr:ABC transporter permease [Anaerolineae bacterium]